MLITDKTDKTDNTDNTNPNWHVLPPHSTVFGEKDELNLVQDQHTQYNQHTSGTTDTVTFHTAYWHMDVFG